MGDAGVIVTAGSENAIADAIADLFENPAKRAQLALAGRQRILDTFCWNLAAHQFENYYHRMLQKASATPKEVAA